MKHLVLVLLLIYILSSCDKIEKPIENGTTLTGKIRLPKADSLIIAKDNPYDFDYDYITIAVTKINPDGSFSINLPFDKPEIVQIKNGDETFLRDVYLFPGTVLNINIDNSNEEDIIIKFDGKYNYVNKFNLDLRKFYPQDEDYNNHLAVKDPNEFIAWADGRRKEMLNYFQNYFIKDSVPPIVNINEISFINFQWAYTRNEWTLRNYYYLFDEWKNDVIPSGYWDFLKNLNFNEPYLHNFLDRYLESLIWQWHIKQVNEGKKPTAKDMEFAKFEIAKSKFRGSTRDIAMCLCINGLLSFDFDEAMVDLTSALIEDLRKNINDKKYLVSIEKKYRKRLALLKGNPAPNITLPNIIDAPISLSDFKGQVIYLYFWGTVYPTSEDLVPILNELQQKFEKNPKVAFISIALENNNVRLWKEFLDKNKPFGVQLYMEGEFSNKFALDYMINSIPTFIIIDKAGKIVTMTAPYPGDEKLVGMLDELSKK